MRPTAVTHPPFIARDFAAILFVFGLAFGIAIAGCGGGSNSTPTTPAVTTQPPPGTSAGPAPTPTPSPTPTPATQQPAPLQFTVQDLGMLSGFISSDATAINNFAQVAGFSFNFNTPQHHAFLFSNGTLQDLGALGGVNSTANGLNNSAQVVGSLTDTQGRTRAFVSISGVMRDLGTLGGANATANGINDLGQIVGAAELAAPSPGQVEPQHAFLNNGGIMRDLGTLGGRSSIANGINATGSVVGESDTTLTCSASPCPDRHAFLFSNGKMQDIGTLGGFSTAIAINNAGQIVGESLSGSNTRAFLFANGTMKDLGAVNGGDSSARAINNAGQIVGFTSNPGAANVFPPQDKHAMIFTVSDNTMRDLNTLLPANSGWVLLSANGINDAGQIVGEGVHNGNSGSAFLLTPVK